MRHRLKLIFCIVVILCAELFAIERFPPPDFESGHQLPQILEPAARSFFYEYIDTAVLLAALCTATYLILKNRSRRLIFVLMVFCLVYFGFRRKGCVCSPGSVGNIAIAVFDNGYAIPVTVLAFFFLPLVFTLFFGRTFCGAVCPLGAIQDIVLIRPVAVTGWLQNALALAAYLYLGLAVLFAATGSSFIICRYDPFVSFFRLSGNIGILSFGASLLIIGMFIGRPYCRFLCPYGVLLRHLSRLSWRRVTITPDDCIVCGLCENSCPFGAIDKPTAEWTEPAHIAKRRLVRIICLAPVIVLASGFIFSRADSMLARVNPTVRLAQRIYLEEHGIVEGVIDSSSAFRGMGLSIEDLYRQAGTIRRQFAVGAWLLGGFMGLAVSCKLVNNSIRKRRGDYQADRANCLACGRCFAYCPRQIHRQNSTDGKV